MKYLITIGIIILSLSAYAQERIDGAFPFQSDPEKKYSLYIPSGYQEDTPHRLMLGLHPLNTNRWDAISWCDTLIVFAEENNLILACPDGGLDGAVDDAIDLAFTDALLDSMQVWYNIDNDKTYAMGFSWGGKTTYTYGLSRPEIFKGYLPIGSAMNGTGEVTNSLSNAKNKPIYIVHGSNDSPSSRFVPIRDALEENEAILETNLLQGVGHTIDFPNRNAIITTAFRWIDSVNCANLSTSTFEIDRDKVNQFQIESHLITDQDLTLFYHAQTSMDVNISIINMSGQVMRDYGQYALSPDQESINIDISSIASRVHFVHVRAGDQIDSYQVMITR